MVALKQFFCIVTIIFSLFVGIYFYGSVIVKTFADRERVVFWNWPLPVHFVNSKCRNKVWCIHGQPRIPAQALGEKWRVDFKKKRYKKLYSAYESHWQDMFQQ